MTIGTKLRIWSMYFLIIHEFDDCVWSNIIKLDCFVFAYNDIEMNYFVFLLLQCQKYGCLLWFICPTRVTLLLITDEFLSFFFDYSPDICDDWSSYYAIFLAFMEVFFIPYLYLLFSLTKFRWKCKKIFL